MEIDIPEVLAELTAAFEEYERALLSNNPEVLIRLFWPDTRTIRYGVAENLYGADAIAAFRHKRAERGGAPQRKTTRRQITTYGRDTAVASTKSMSQAARSSQGASDSWLSTARASPDSSASRVEG